MTISTFDSPRDSERERNAQRFDQERQDEDVRDDDTTLDEPIVARERAEERERAAARQNATARATTSGSNAPHEFGTSYLGGSTDEQWQKWRQIQGDFVDNPRSAVADAHRLVGEMMDDIVRRFEEERNQLEQRWSSGEDVNTEELRTCLQTYRDFFGRLLANVDAKH
jgi:hypothetical protein